VAPDGILPNSVLVGGLRKSDADQLLAQGWVPPSLSDTQRKLMEEMKEVSELHGKETGVYSLCIWYDNNLFYLKVRSVFSLDFHSRKNNFLVLLVEILMTVVSGS